ncbi:MAG: hypothetical protein GC201_03125 [Alphaproteobacteria bacterium]|nr:hypothetical protein [Alphaproteobacteria bacterium]
MSDHLLVAISSAQPGREDEFNAWYETVHMGEVLNLPGFVGARRYEPAQEGDEPARYMAVYEIEGDADVAMGALMDTVKGGGFTMSDSIDSSTVSMVLYRARTPRMMR